MKLKKIILLIISVILLSGCTVEYNLNISKDFLEEDITLISDDESDSIEITNYFLPTPAFVNSAIQSESSEKLEGVEYYETNKFIGSNGYYNYNMKYKFNYDNYKESNIVNNSVSIFNFYEKRGIYYIETGAKIKAFTEDNNLNKLNVIVNLSDDLELVSSNADSINGNTLTWNIEKTNSKTNPITIQYKEKKTNNNNPSNIQPNIINKPLDSEDNSTSLIFALIVLFVFMFVLIIFITIKNRNKK